MKLTREVKTAILAIVAILLLIFGYNFLKGQNLLDNNRTFYAVYDNVEGLAPASDVTINGLNIGKVVAIEFLDQTGNLLVTFEVDSDFEFSKQSVAKIYGGSLIGGKSLAIEPKYEGPKAVSGDTLNGVIDTGMMELVNELLPPLQSKIEGTIVSADSLLQAVNSVLDPGTRQNLRNTIASLSATATQFQGASKSLNEILVTNRDKLDRTFSNLDEMSSNFAKISDTLSQVEVGRLVANLEKVVNDFQGIANNLKEGKGTAGKLLQDEQVYDNLEGATRQLEQLLQDLKLNPKRYVHFSLFGKNNKEYTPPQDSLR
ncbi:MlaD family protein [Croceiramulus getboli]|nr:MlaD family protein [Flavobacteriaceae bacterium YJPT1-3]